MTDLQKNVQKRTNIMQHCIGLVRGFKLFKKLWVFYFASAAPKSHLEGWWSRGRSRGSRGRSRGRDKISELVLKILGRWKMLLGGLCLSDAFIVLFGFSVSFFLCSFLVRPWFCVFLLLLLETTVSDETLTMQNCPRLIKNLNSKLQCIKMQPLWCKTVPDWPTTLVSTRSSKLQHIRMQPLSCKMVLDLLKTKLLTSFSESRCITNATPIIKNGDRLIKKPEFLKAFQNYTSGRMQTLPCKMLPDLPKT